MIKVQRVQIGLVTTLTVACVVGMVVLLSGLTTGRIHPVQAATTTPAWYIQSGAKYNDVRSIVTLTDGTHHVVCDEIDRAVSCVKVD